MKLQLGDYSFNTRNIRQCEKDTKIFIPEKERIP